MSLSTALNNSLLGMSTASLRAELSSFNIANAGNENFARRSVNLFPGLSGGLASMTIDRAVAGRSEATFLQRTGQEAEAAVLTSATNALFGAFGDPAQGTGLYGAIQNLETGLRDLQTTPESPALQEAAALTVQDVATTFEDLSTTIEAVRLDADGSIETGVDAVNDALHRLKALNASAARSTGSEMSTVAERQKALVAEIASALDVKVSGQYGDVISVRTGQGVLLLGADVHEIRFDSAGSMDFAARYEDGDLSGLSVDGIDITPGAVQGTRGGSLAAHFTVRDRLGTDIGERVDALASDIHNRLATADPTDAEGLLTLLPGGGSAADRLRIHPGIDTALGGEVWRVRDGVGSAGEGPAASEGIIADIRTALEQPLSNLSATGSTRSYSFAALVGAVGDQLGTSALKARQRQEQATTALAVEREAVLRATGVDTDQELQQLLMIEQAFAANARVTATIDEMLARLMEI